MGSSATGWRRSRAAQKSNTFPAASTGKQSVGGGKKGKKLGGIGNLKGSLGGAREPVWDECIYAAGLVPKDARRAGGRCLTDLVCGEETVRACRQQTSLGEHTLGSNSMGSKRNHRKKTPEVWGSL